ncbi:helicase-related protein [Paenibacillus protaetiae]|uniref:helicase-related protein n=1 Tax=Paenibacillus protaetiae TaxID=2509456 RepID=UPI0031342509
MVQTEPMALLLRKELNLELIAAVHSQDPDRADKVQQFRRRELRILVTTTILERGVTVPQSDVFILDADGRLFDSSSLVQMAGRAGRSGDDPKGFVYFCALERSRSQLGAVKQIRSMNKTARSAGYLLP